MPRFRRVARRVTRRNVGRAVVANNTAAAHAAQSPNKKMTVMQKQESKNEQEDQENKENQENQETQEEKDENEKTEE